MHAGDEEEIDVKRKEEGRQDWVFKMKSLACTMSYWKGNQISKQC